MWGGIYAVLFSIVTITSTENPLRNGFPFDSSKPYEKITFSKVEFQDKIVGDELQYSYYLDRKYGLSNQGILCLLQMRRFMDWIRFYKKNKFDRQHLY